ncbi:sigma-70 family RNA polymerase sigma factor [Aquimarina sp. MMG015]|uniref:RNA polymerase sigma factor n=1 Tax=Aquimarina TaxID=290174 RepID=UPI000409AC1B|nr:MULTISPECIES: sigma-70 family RNA polymerase sigma factor [Aquimarina]MBQ4802102.1 sigma-70 family RNA polymerase sigma factor [Aquimarina sp. MMG015]
MRNSQYKQEYDLIRRINDGDASAFRQLVYVYKDVSLSLAISILKNQVIAEDVLQEVFLKVYNKLHTFRFKSSFSTWLYRIVINTSYNELKKRKNSINIDELESGFIISLVEKNAMDEADQKRFINLALQQLRPDEALVLRLFYLCEYKIKEIEKVTGFKTSKIKVDLYRGRENMHFQLKRLLGDDLNNLL